MKESQRLGRFIAVLISRNVTAVLLSFLFLVTIPRLLEPENMGFYSWWFTVYCTLYSLQEFGNAALARYIPEMLVRGPGQVRNLFKNIVYLKLLIVLVSAGAGALLLQDRLADFSIVALAAAFVTVQTAFQSTFYGHNNMWLYAGISNLKSFLKILILGGLFLLAGAAGILWSLAVTDSVVVLIFLLPLAKTVGLRSPSVPMERPFMYYLSYGAPLYLSALFFTVTNRSAVLLSQHYGADLALIGCLGLAIEICLFAARRLTLSVSEALLPSLVTYHASKDHEMLGRSLELNWKYTNIVLFPVLGGLVVLAEPMVALVPGAKYLPAVELIRLTAPATLLVVWTQVHQQILMLAEERRKILFTHLLNLLVFLIAAVCLIGRLGVLGAPLALVVGSLPGYVYIRLASTGIHRIRSYSASLYRPYFASLVMAAAIGFIPVPSLPVLAGVVCLGAIIYVAALYLIGGIHKLDIERVLHVFR